MFEDRKHAGRRLANALASCRRTPALVLGIPRGGVEVAGEIATQLRLDLSVILVRTLPLPDHPDLGFGAIAEDGTLAMREEALPYLDPKTVAEILQRQKAGLTQDLKRFRRGKPLPSLTGRHVILVDDGVVTGTTMSAALQLLKKRSVGRVTLAAPVGRSAAVRRLESLADETVILEKPYFLKTVSQAYRQWRDLDDAEVVSLLSPSWIPPGSLATAGWPVAPEIQNR